MPRIVLAIAILALAACGGQETATTETPGAAESDLLPVEAQQQAAESFPQVERCLDLIRQTAFARALPVCLEAFELDPENQQVQAALDQATAEVARLEGAGAAAEEAAGEAASRLEETTGELPGRLGE